MRVDSHDLYTSVGEFDPATGDLVELARDALDATPPSGHYARLAGTLVVLYRDGRDLWIRIGGTARNCADKGTSIEWGRSGTASRLALSTDGREVAAVEYVVVGEGGGPADPTPFADPEDWDFGLFVKNVLDDVGRSERIYQGRSV